TAAAAMLVLWLIGRPPTAAHKSAWIAVRAASTTADGKAIEIGAPLVVGALVHVGDGGAARLERASGNERASVELDANSEARVGDGALELLAGSARLEGPEARLTGDVAEVTTLGSSARATVELRRNPMLTKNTAALAVLLTVGVADGGARVVAKGHDPLLLAKNDRTMIAPKLPPLTTRAAKPAAAKKPAPQPAAQPSGAPATGGEEGQLDKDVIRATVQRHILELRFCYEQALKDRPGLGGKFEVRMTLVTHGSESRVSDAEIVPADESYLESMSMQSCVLQAVSRWHFPPSRDGDDVVVGYPFVFKTGDED
ncbi:MAG: hypothetical protein JWM53_6277, partial [bacterium]|nr:hypothetical protein [bacterium]